MELETGRTSDKGVGFVVLFGLLAIAGALLMLFDPGTVVGAWGFAAAIVTGLALIVAIHVYWG